MDKNYENKILDIANELQSKTKRGGISSVMLEDGRVTTDEKEIYEYLKRNSLIDIK